MDEYVEELLKDLNYFMTMMVYTTNRKVFHHYKRKAKRIQAELKRVSLTSPSR